MGNFINDEGKIMSEEELKQVTGGWVLDRSSGFWDILFKRCCPKCGGMDLKITGVSPRGTVLYVTCKKCGHEFDIVE